LQAPAPPSPPTTSFFIQLSSTPPAGVSIPQSGSFYGFSIEMSVINQVLGLNASFIQPPFLNLMANLEARGGSVRVRVGGNTQETATLVDSLADGKMIEKQAGDPNNPTYTPALLYTPQMFYLMANISALVNVHWYLGIPLNDTTHLRLGIAEMGEKVLGDYLIGFQVGNEPDQYALHDHRPANYSQWDYFGEFGVVLDALNADTNVETTQHKLIGPSLSGFAWGPEAVWNTGFITVYQPNLQCLAFEFYPNNNCAALFGGSPAVDPQSVFPDYLNHFAPYAGTQIVKAYLNSTNIAQTYDLPFVMFETNTASCGGFRGVSNSFGAALWALDYGLTMAYSNFTGAMLHVGGQSTFYNPFTPPPTNQSTFHQWTIGPVYYATLIVAEAFGKTNTSRIIDLQANADSAYTPAYAIYENDAIARLALFNYVTDPTGASDYVATFAVGGGSTGQANLTPAQVKVKYLLAPSVSERSNITWANQTFGAAFETDGRPMGDMYIETVACNQTGNICQVTVPAPGFAMVFITDPDSDDTTNAQTYSTTAYTKTRNTATVDPSVLATSNGHSGMEFGKGSTSPGSVQNGANRLMPPLLVLLGILCGVFVMAR